MNRSVASFYWGLLGHAPRVLDLGCGFGGLGQFGPPGTKVFGVDLDSSRSSAARCHEHLTICDLDQKGSLPFADHSFDAVVAKDILEHLQRPWLTVRDICRVLRPGGKVLASVICENPARIANDYTHVRGFTRKSARNLFEDSGLSVIDVWRMGPLPLASRLGAIAAVPHILRVPGVSRLFTSSYEVLAILNQQPSRSVR